MKKYNELISSFNTIRSKPEPLPAPIVEQKEEVAPIEQSPQTLREQYIAGDLFTQGEFVRTKSTNSVLQVVECCSNYLRVVDQMGRSKRVWIDSVARYSPSKIVQRQFVSALREDQIFFKGYQTKNFTSEITEAFVPILESSDPFAILSAIRATDEFLIAKDIANKYALFEKAGKFLFKHNIQEHTYREAFEQEIAEMIIEDVPSILKITANDREKTAKLIGSVVGVDQKGTPEEIINRSAKRISNQKHAAEVLEIFGQMFALADEVGIQWDREIFSAEQLESLGLKEAVFDEAWLTTFLNEAADSISSFADVIDLYEANELVVVQGTKTTLLEQAEGETVVQAAQSAIKTNPIIDKQPKQIAVAQPDEKKLGRRARQFALKYLRDRATRHSANKLSERERKRLEDIILNKGSIITNASKNLFKKLTKIEAERLLNQESTK